MEKEVSKGSYIYITGLAGMGGSFVASIIQKRIGLKRTAVFLLFLLFSSSVVAPFALKGKITHILFLFEFLIHMVFFNLVLMDYCL